MASIPPYAVGADWIIPIPLVHNGTPLNVSAATALTAMVVSKDSRSAFSAAITLSGSESGANHTGGLVVAVIPRATTKSIPAGEYAIEVQATVATRVYRFRQDQIVVIRGLHPEVP